MPGVPQASQKRIEEAPLWRLSSMLSSSSSLRNKVLCISAHPKQSGLFFTSLLYLHHHDEQNLGTPAVPAEELCLFAGARAPQRSRVKVSTASAGCLSALGCLTKTTDATQRPCE